MADDIAEEPALGLRHPQTPLHLRHHVGDGRGRQLGRGAKAVFQVLVALTHDLQIKRYDQSIAPGGLRAFDQAVDEILVPHHIELKPERCGRIPGHVLDRTDRHRGKGERHPHRFGGLRGKDFAVRVLHPRQTDRRQRHRHRDLAPDHRGPDRPALHVDRNTLAQPDKVEVGFILAIGLLGPAAGLAVVVEHPGDAAAVEPVQVFDVGNDGGHVRAPEIGKAF